MSALLILYAVFLTGVNDFLPNKEFLGDFMIFSRLLFSLHLVKHNIRILRTSLFLMSAQYLNPVQVILLAILIQENQEAPTQEVET